MPSYNAYNTRVIQPGSTDLMAAAIRVALLTSSYTPDLTHVFFSDVNANEVVGTGYTAGGELLATKTVTQDDMTNKSFLDADDTQWPASTITARYAVVYIDTGVPGTSRLIGYIDFQSNKSSNSGTFTLQWQAGGIVVVQSS